MESLESGTSGGLAAGFGSCCGSLMQAWAPLGIGVTRMSGQIWNQLPPGPAPFTLGRVLLGPLSWCLFSGIWTGAYEPQEGGCGW